MIHYIMGPRAKFLTLKSFGSKDPSSQHPLNDGPDVLLSSAIFCVGFSVQFVLRCV